MEERQAVVFCSASDRIDPKYNQAARDVVRALPAYGWRLVLFADTVQDLTKRVRHAS